MPIVVQNYTWTQTDKTVNIRVPVSDAVHEKVDLFTTNWYIKANYSPYIFEVFLLHDVDISKSTCYVKDDIIILDLIKQEEITWNALEKDLTKAEKMNFKNEVLSKTAAQMQQATEDRRVKKTQLDRFSVQRAMDIDSKQHEIMDARRDAERNKAMNDLEEWRTKTDEKEFAMNSKKIFMPEKTAKIIELPDEHDESKTNQTKSEVSENSADVLIENLEIKAEDPAKKEDSIMVKNEKKKSDEFKFIFPKSSQKPPIKTPVRSEYVEKKQKEAKKRVLPRLREGGQLEVTHTFRTFPTPSRESRAEEEDAWIKNITLARRATGFVSEDLRPEEQDPQWCKDKGDEFFRNGNFLGAVSAYSHGIRLSEKLPSLYANRAATHFALGNFNKCLTDCSTALDLMKPICEANRVSRARCIARRGAALVRLGYLSKAIDEMKAASKLLPDDEKIKQDIFEMERAWEQNPDSN